MNATENETVRFSVKPNPFLYALEFTRHTLLAVTAVLLWTGIPIWPGIYFGRTGALLLLTAYALLGLLLFIVAYVAACHLMFVVTNKRAIVRSSFWGKTRDRRSIAIESVKHIAITSYGARYGSVYLTYDKTAPREISTADESDYPQPGSIRRARDEEARASAPIERTNSIWHSMTTWPRLLGFYGFKGFDEFANIISEQKNSIRNVKGDQDANPQLLILHCCRSDREVRP